MSAPRSVLAALAGGAIAIAARLPLAAADRPPPPANPNAHETAAPTPDQLYDAGKALFDEYAPPEIKQQIEFPSRREWDEFAAKLQQALAGDSFEKLAAYAPQARAALAVLRALPDYADDATWLEERLDLIEAAGAAGRQPAPARETPSPAAGAPRRPAMPYYDLWVERLRGRPVPPGAAALLPELRAAFAAAGVPADLAWMAEVESAFNPRARSPAGARGLFQLMPETAQAFGLRTWLPDERTDPEKSARAAAQLLRHLHDRFGDWPLALAAYNAGEGRVGRALAGRQARQFAEIEPALPAETRLYVPKVYATIAVRGGKPPPAAE